MNPTIWKDNLREIKKTFPRFLSIFAIIALGVAFFIGIKATGPAMVETSKQYFEAYNLPDGTVLSTGGLKEDDLALLADHPGTKWLTMQSIETNLRPGTETAKVFTYDGNQATNFFRVVEGRLPETTNEIALDAKFLELINPAAEEPIEIGDKVTLEQPDTYEETNDEDITSEAEGNSLDVKAPEFVETEFTVVGFVNTPLYFERISRGIGTVSVFAVVVDEAVVGDVYSEAYFWLDDAREFEAYSDEYQSVVEEHQLAMEESLNGQPLTRINELRHDLNELIRSGQEEIDDGYRELEAASDRLAEADGELKDGWQEYFEGMVELSDAQQQIDEGYAEIETGQADLAAGWAEIAENEALLAENEATYQAGYADYLTGVAEFESGIVAGEAELDAGEEELAAAKETLDESRTRLETAEQEVAVGRTQLAAAQQQILDGLLEQLPIEVDSVDALLKYLEEQGVSIDNLTETIRQQLEGLPQQLETIREDLTHVEVEIQELETDNQVLKAEQATLIEQQPPLQTTIVEREAAWLVGQAELSRLTDEAAILQAQLNETLPTIPGELDPETGEATDPVPNPEYSVLEQQVVAAQEKVSQQQQLVAAAKESLTSAQLELETLNQRLLEIEQSIVDNETQIETLRQEQVDLLTQLDLLEELLTEENQEQLREQLRELLSQREAIEGQLDELLAGIQELQAAEAELLAAEQEIAAGWQQYNDGYSQYEAGIQELEEGRERLNIERATGQRLLDEANSELQAGRLALDDGYSQLEAGKQTLTEGEQELIEALATIQEGEAELQQGQIELAEAYATLTDGTQTLRYNQLVFDEESVTALEKLAEGEADLEEVRAELTKLEEPIYYVNTRESAEAYASVYENAEKLNVISNIFPVFFFAIAVLVTFTTVKRMASEQRNYMGTMKQMGYPNHVILSKFVMYAGVASILGVIVGTVIGYQLFPGLIVGAYNSLYYFDTPYLVYSPSVILIIAIIALTCAIGPAVMTPLSILRTRPAQLLQPEPPKVGQNIMLERISWLWNLLSFKRKMTIRNLLRYKGRNAMTLVGIAGCTMLIATGFGIGDTISIIVDAQFGDIQTYNSMVFLSDRYETDELIEFSKELNQSEGVEQTLPVMTKTLETTASDQTVQPITVVVPLVDESLFSEFVHLHLRDEPELALSLNETGPILTERIVEFLATEAGENITLVDDKQQTYDIPIGAVSENYIGHYLYLSPEQYEEIFYEQARVNTFYLKYQGSNHHVIEQKLSDDDRVMTLMNLTAVEQTASESMGSLGFITLVLIIAAAGLAFIVIYNLTNINIAERMRELSTIKVLGFYNREVSMYIYEEILVLTGLGSLIGLGLGRLLTFLILKQMQLNNLLFYPTVKLDSYVISAGLTFVFSSLVMIFMHHKLKNIDMVEALKAVE